MLLADELNSTSSTNVLCSAVLFTVQHAMSLDRRLAGAHQTVRTNSQITASSKTEQSTLTVVRVASSYSGQCYALLQLQLLQAQASKVITEQELECRHQTTATARFW